MIPTIVTERPSISRFTRPKYISHHTTRHLLGLSHNAQTVLVSIISLINVPFPPSQHLRTPSQELSTLHQCTHILTPEGSSVVSTIPELEINVTINHVGLCTYVQYATSMGTLHRPKNTVALLQSGPGWTQSLPGMHSYQPSKPINDH